MHNTILLIMNITLNVGGQIFKTTFDIIIKIPYFRDMFESCDESPHDIIFVNRSGHVFKHIFALVIDPLYPYPKKYAFELDFYGIDYKNINFYDKQQEILNEMNKKFEIIENSLKCVNSNRNIQNKSNSYDKYQIPKNVRNKSNVKTWEITYCEFFGCKNRVDNNVKHCKDHANISSECNRRTCSRYKLSGAYCGYHT